jgi:NAD-dependent SIR2 family protein deacetylase
MSPNLRPLDTHDAIFEAEGKQNETKLITQNMNKSTSQDPERMVGAVPFKCRFSQK